MHDGEISAASNRKAVRSIRLARGWAPAAGDSYRRPCGLAMLVAVAAIGLTACGGGSPDAPHVANLGTSTTTVDGRSGGSAIPPKGDNATHLMDEWATCMRANGDPNQSDPTIDQYGVINITMPSGTSAALSSEVHGSSGPCSQYELAAENDLRAANPVAPPPTQAQLLQYVDCMRTHGVPNYPDPGPNDETNFNGTGVDLNSQSFENANNVCGKQVNAPAWWIAGTGPPGDVVVSSAGIGPNGPVPGNRPATVLPAPGGNRGSGSNA
jgi:hypothetical protein